jgi:hypothetical protein
MVNRLQKKIKEKINNKERKKIKEITCIEILLIDICTTVLRRKVSDPNTSGYYFVSSIT